MNTIDMVELGSDDLRAIDGGVIPLLLWAGYAFVAGLTVGTAAGTAALAAK